MMSIDVSRKIAVLNGVKGVWISTKTGRHVFIPLSTFSKITKEQFKDVKPGESNGRKGFWITTKNNKKVFIPLQRLKDVVEKNENRLHKNRKPLGK